MERLLNTIAWPAIALLLLCFVSTAAAFGNACAVAAGVGLDASICGQPLRLDRLPG